MEQTHIQAIYDFGGAKRGDVVEFICLTGAHELIHGHSTILYICTAYAELANEMIVDGLDNYGEAQIAIVINGNLYPRPIQKTIATKTLAKLQRGGKRLQEPYQRVFSLIGKPLGFSLEYSNGRFIYKKTHDAPHSSGRYAYRKKKQVYKEVERFFPTPGEARKIKVGDNWREQMKNEYIAAQRKKKVLEPEDIPTMEEEEEEDIRKMIPNLGIIEPEVWHT